MNSLDTIFTATKIYIYTASSRNHA